jgi:hypothetical protein
MSRIINIFCELKIIKNYISFNILNNQMISINKFRATVKIAFLFETHWISSIGDE